MALANINGYATTAINFSRSADLIHERNLEGIRQITIPALGPPGRAGSFLQILPRSSREALRRICQDVDVIHLHSVFQVDHIFARHLHVPFIVTPHGGYHPRVLAGEHALRKRVWKQLFDRPALRDASQVHVLSERERADVLAIQATARVSVLPIPVLGMNHAQDFNRASDGPIVFIGRMDIDHKGLDLLLRAWAQALADWPDSVNLVLAGPGDRGSAYELTRLCQRLGISRRVDFMGPVAGDEKARLLERASWFVHTSRREGLPLAMVEAAGRGIPLLATEETNLGDAIRRQRAGLVCGLSVDAIAQMLKTAAQTVASQRNDFTRGATRLSLDFSPEVAWPQYDGMYREAASAT